jgi:uncharacterized protein
LADYWLCHIANKPRTTDPINATDDLGPALADSFKHAKFRSMKGNISCPTCKKEGHWFAEPYGPFCSRRCKLIDLGKWFTEEHVISKPLTQHPIGQASEPNPEELDHLL